jgi:CDP-diacylglycerol--glycerol-3-phosphate 3-phosphatidyltransferase
MFRHVPNLLTGGRLLLAAVFFCLLAYYQYEGRGDPWLLNVALAVYVVALATDFLDGFLARRWHVEGQFGRLVDPFVDKILVLGAFIFFAGKNFIIPATATHAPGDNTMVVKTLTGVAPGIVVILLARELLVTTFRGMGESSGKNFGAAFIGKLKMGFQSATILVILAYVNYYHRFHNTPAEWWITVFRDFAIWATVAITVYSGLVYLRKAMAMLREQPATPAPAQDPPKGAAA